METLTAQSSITKSDYTEIKKSILKEVAKLRLKQKEDIAYRILSLPSLAGVPEIEALKKQNGFAGKMKNSVPKKQVKHTIEGPPGLSFCYYPPYTFSSGIYYEYPHSTYLPPDSYEDSFYNPFSFVNLFTGEIGLSCISGQSYGIFYGGGFPFPFINGVLGNYKHSCGSITQTIDLPSPFETATTLEITLNAELPASFEEAVDLKPGNATDFYYGLVGAEGIIDMLVTYELNGEYHTTQAPTTDFLSAWQTALDNDPIASYNANPVSKVKVTIPSGVTHIRVTCVPFIYAHSMVDNDVSETNDTVRNYALIDFRIREGSNRYPIISNLFGADHITPGAIKIKSICVDFEPTFFAIRDNEGI